MIYIYIYRSFESLRIKKRIMIINQEIGKINKTILIVSIFGNDEVYYVTPLILTLILIR